MVPIYLQENEGLLLQLCVFSMILMRLIAFKSCTMIIISK